MQYPILEILRFDCYMCIQYVSCVIYLYGSVYSPAWNPNQMNPHVCGVSCALAMQLTIIFWGQLLYFSCPKRKKNKPTLTDLCGPTFQQNQSEFKVRPSLQKVVEISLLQANVGPVVFEGHLLGLLNLIWTASSPCPVQYSDCMLSSIVYIYQYSYLHHIICEAELT